MKENKQKQKDLVMENIYVKGYEKVIKVTNKKTKLQAIISIHNTKLGPALGGIRIYPYKNFKDALTDVMRLSKGMTYKSAVSEVGFGGGKSVIIADPKREKTEELLTSFGEAIEALEGQYIGAEDVGCGLNDVMVVRKKTKFILGLPHEKSSGDPSRYTAFGVLRGIQSVLKRIYGSKSMLGKKIAIQGLGSVGSYLVDYLFWSGADIVVTDIDKDKVEKTAKKYGIEAVSPEEIFNVECDVFSPCALGGVINDETVKSLKCKAVAGCANNQLLDEEHGDLLHERGILVAPDFVINAGGLINVSFEMEKRGYHPKGPRHKTDKIYDVLMSIYEIADKSNISTTKAAIELAKYKIKYGLGKRASKLYFHHSAD
jgi:leucine dehydrogenase